MKHRHYLLLAAVAAALQCGAALIKSPDGKVVVSTSVNEEGMPVYTLFYRGKTVIKDAPLGLVTDFTDLSRDLTERDARIKPVSWSYTQDKIKKSHIDVNATNAIVEYEGYKDKRLDKDRRLDIEWHVADNGVAFRYHVPRQQERGSMVVKEETSSFAFPQGTTTFLTPQAHPMTGWKRTKPSYEEWYVVDAPMEKRSEFGHGFTFPALFKTPQGIWTLITETGVDGYYCGSRLSDYADGRYTIAFPMPEENNGNGTSSPGVALPGHTPWRVMAIGDNLAPIVETTLPWDLVEPKYETLRAARPGKGTWSWILWQDGSINYDDQVKYIDFAAEMGYDNVLIDNFWDERIGKERMADLIDYAHNKGIKPILWFSSSGHWNDIEQSPVNGMDRPIERKKWMKWLRDNGVDAIKVDFFGGDKQETMRLYEDILSDAADYGIDVIFHGCTLPRGWERMYPNFVGAEAVMASENMVFDQSFANHEGLHATLHPFIRNSAAIMEYGGTFLNKRFNRGNDGGKVRMTNDAFQLALSVLFQNPVQNFALAPNNLQDAPKVSIDFMRNVPTTWDDTKFIDGYPGRYAVVARRHGDTWYVAGVSNLDHAVTLKLRLPMFKKGEKINMINDGKMAMPIQSELKLKDPQSVEVVLHPSSGFVLWN